MMEDLIKYHRDVAGPGPGPGTISDWSDMTIVHFIPKGEDMTDILYDYHVLRIPNVLITGDCNLMVGCESDMSFAVVLGKRYVPDDCKDDDEKVYPEVYKRLKDDLLVSHMYNWDDIIIPHIPAFYIENADLQYIDYWDPNALDTLLENGTIKEVRRIVVI